jgi:hypothetical protein
MILNKLRLNAAKAFGLSIVLAIAKCIAYSPTIAVSSEINVNLQGNILDGQQIFYSVYNADDKTTLVKNQAINRDDRNFKIKLPLLDRTKLNENGFSRQYKYDVIIYGVRADKYDIAVPFRVEVNLSDIRKLSMPIVEGTCRTYYINISEEVKLVHTKEIEIKLSPTEFDRGGDIYSICGAGEMTPSDSGNSSPNKIVQNPININLNYSIKSFLTMKKKPIEENLSNKDYKF